MTTHETGFDTTKAVSALLLTGWQHSCPFCNKSVFQIQEGLFINVLQKDWKTIELGGNSIPVIVLICTNCGFVSQHSLGILGLLEESS